MIWRLQMLLAMRLGWYRYHGSLGLASIRHPRWPFARVKYTDGTASMPMPLGNAVEYREMFGGTIERVDRPT